MKTEVVTSVEEVKEQTKSCLSEIVAISSSKDDKASRTSSPPLTPVRHSQAPPRVPEPIRAPPPPTHHVKKKTAYLSKPRIRYVGNTAAHNADFANVEKATKTRIKTVKAYSSVKDEKSRNTYKNVTDVASGSLADTPVEDQYTQMILAAPTDDITYLDTSDLKPDDNIEVLKQKVYISCKNIFTVAETSLKNFPMLNKVVIVEHPIRSDNEDGDPIGIKPVLTKYANAIYAQLWLESAVKDKVLIKNFGGKENMQYNLTESLIDMVSNALPYTRPSKLPNQTSDHTNCPQALYQKRKKTTYQPNTNHNSYNIPVYNKFSLLGN